MPDSSRLGAVSTSLDIDDDVITSQSLRHDEGLLDDHLYRLTTKIRSQRLAIYRAGALSGQKTNPRNRRFPFPRPPILGLPFRHMPYSPKAYATGCWAACG